MKKLFAEALLVLYAIVMLQSCDYDYDCKAKYKIVDSRGYKYYTDTYISDCNCVSFVNYTGESVKICGSYRIVEQKTKN